MGARGSTRAADALLPTPGAPGKARLVERSFRVLFRLAAEADGLALAPLSREVGLARATTLRILRALRALQIVDLDDAARVYRLGPAAYRLGAAAIEQHDVARIARPFLERLGAATGETACLFRRQGSERICVAAVQSTQDLRFAMAVGQRRPLLRGAPGRLLVAYLPPDQLHQVLQSLGPARRRALIERSRHIRARGFAVSRDEVVPGGTAVAAPVRGSDGRVVAALAVLGPSARLNTRALRRMVGRVARTARAISTLTAGPAVMPS